MIGYVTLGTNDLARATAFYDELLGVIGAGRFMEMDTFVAWAVSPTKPGLAVTKPFDGNPATVGNGVMVALAVASPEQVQAATRGRPGRAATAGSTQATSAISTATSSMPSACRAAETLELR